MPTRPRRTILGVLDVKMSLAQVDIRLADARRELLYASVAAVLLVGLISGGFIWLVVRRPVRKLMRGMQMVSTGDLTQHLLATSQDELGLLAQTFNSMTEELVARPGGGDGLVGDARAESPGKDRRSGAGTPADGGRRENGLAGEPCLQRGARAEQSARRHSHVRASPHPAHPAVGTSHRRRRNRMRTT